jgi:hypothetical protein
LVLRTSAIERPDCRTPAPSESGPFCRCRLKSDPRRAGSRTPKVPRIGPLCRRRSNRIQRGTRAIKPGIQKASYYFSGDSATSSTTDELEAPHSDNWQFTDEVETDQLSYKPPPRLGRLGSGTPISVDPPRGQPIAGE